MNKAGQLKQRIFKASIWILISNFAGHGLRLVSNLILTRLLVPEMFGLMSIISAMLMGLFMLTDVGLKLNVIQSKRSDMSYLNTVWTIGLIRGFVIWLLSLIGALALYFAQQYSWVPLDTVYADPMLPLVIPVFSLTVIIGAFEPTWTAIDGRNLKQGRLVRIGIISQVVGVVFMVIFAWYSRSIWALVLGSLVGPIVRSLIVNFYIKAERNQFHIDKHALREIFHFGKWLFLSSMIGFLANTSDQFMLGGLITPTQLGVYNIAAVLIVVVSQTVTSLVSSVAYPALSETIRDKPYDLQRIYYRFRIPFDLGALFLTGFIYISGSVIIKVLYDDRYLDAGWIIGILSFGLLAIRYQISSQCFMALGHTKIMTIQSLIRTISMFVFLPIGFKYYGLVGAIWASTLVNFSVFPLLIYYKKMHGIWDIKKELITLPMILVGMAVGWLFNQTVHLVLGRWI
jgi:O-antigen/teichoic acid export membrane protein